MPRGSRPWCFTNIHCQWVRPQDEKLKQQLLKYTACHRGMAGDGLRWFGDGCDTLSLNPVVNFQVAK